MKYPVIFLAANLLTFHVGLGVTFSYENDSAFPHVDGMTIEYNYPVYTGEDLWDYINGASDGYMAYHFEELKIAEYKDNGGSVVKVEVYKHQRPEDAYGIYSTERSPDYHFVEIGAEGYAEPSLVNFVAGPYYVKVISGAGETGSTQKLMKIARTLCKSMVDKPELPEVLSVFPSENKVEHSESFVSSNVLGHEFLQDAFKMDYKIGDTSFSILVFDRDRTEDCVSMLKANYGYTNEEMPTTWENGFYTINDKYNGTINFHLQDNVLFGFLELEDKTLVDRLAGIIMKNLSN